ncbi:MAG TPA: hypothetical protein DCL38_04220, partial [Lachnospiraceae bacterium]|nr:hypothetical protein [Lachnospiraceae bacterium]
MIRRIKILKQFQTVYQDKLQFSDVISDWQKTLGEVSRDHVVFHIFSDGADEADVHTVCKCIEQTMPEADYVGSAASGSIYEGCVTDNPLTVTATVLEAKDSFFRIRQLRIEDLDTTAMKDELSSMSADFSGVKAIEVLMTIDSIPVRRVCDLLKEYLPEHVPVFGGGAFGDNTHDAFNFTKHGSFSKNSVILLMFGGPDFHIANTYIMGWKPLGAPLKVTRSEGRVLYELDGEPAFKTYEHYLRIPNDDNLFYNALEFPFAVSRDDKVVLRHALSCDENGALTMSTDIPEGRTLHLTYGDPETILDNVRTCSKQITSFFPEVIAVFDCFGRKTFWGNNEDASKETIPFHAIAPTYGFCTAGEFVRMKDRGRDIEHHNLSLVIAGMREGGPTEKEIIDRTDDLRQSDTTMSLVNRLANYINTAKAELVEANRTLSILAVTDRLTNMYNRGEIQRRISERISENMTRPELDRATSLIMIDLDDFKRINDTYGHSVGD